MIKLNPISIYAQVIRAAYFPWYYPGSDWPAAFRLSDLMRVPEDCFSRKGLLKNLISSPE